jgi:hypothetical protein
MKAIEAAADKAGVTCRDGETGTAWRKCRRLENPADHKVVVLCGHGNNGGGGGAYLAEGGLGSVAHFAKMPRTVRRPDIGVRQTCSSWTPRTTSWRVLKDLMGGVTVLVTRFSHGRRRRPLKRLPNAQASEEGAPRTGRSQSLR